MSDPKPGPRQAVPPPDQRSWEVALLARYVGVIALAGSVALVPAVGRHRQNVALFILAAGLLSTALHHFLYRRRGRPPASMPFLDIFICACVVLLEPRTLAPTLLVALTTIAVTAVVFGQRLAIPLAATAVAAMALVVVVRRPDGAPLAAGGFAITTSVVVAAVGESSRRDRQMRARYTSLVEGLNAIVWETDVATFQYDYVSPMAERVLGYPVERWGEKSFFQEVVHPDDAAELTGTFTKNVRAGRDHELEYRARAADGRWVYLHDQISVKTDASGAPVVVRGVTVDVSERRRAEERVHQYADIVERIQVALLILRSDDDDASALRFVAANPAAERAIGRPLEEVLGSTLDDVLPQLANGALPNLLHEVLETGRARDRDGVVLRPGVEHAEVFSMHAFPLSGRAVGVSLDDVTSASLVTDALRRQALHDDLTGLPNRTLLKDRLQETLNEHSAVALLILDLDQFKEVNDALGHHHGDLLLGELSRRLQELLPDCEMVARLGGDEFAVLFSDDATVSRAVEVAERIGRSFQQPFLIDDLSLQTNASIGIAMYPDHAGDADSLTQRADVAMYLAKRAGTGHAVYTAEQDHSSVRRLTLLGELRRGLDGDEFRLYYQPVIDLRSGRPVRVEALARWFHPEHGVMPPSDFIGLAEVSGMIQPLTRWVLRQAVEAASSWERAGQPPGVAVNLSVRNLYDPNLPVFMAALLVDHAMAPNKLTLELTESELMEDPRMAKDVLEQLAALGVATAIDDFGTGYSSLTYLKDLPISQIKIDQSFVTGMTNRAEDLAIVRSMVELGHNLGLEVVAEGVADKEALDALTAMGCDMAQGFFIARPLAHAELLDWLADRRRIWAA